MNGRQSVDKRGLYLKFSVLESFGEVAEKETCATKPSQQEVRSGGGWVKWELLGSPHADQNFSRYLVDLLELRDACDRNGCPLNGNVRTRCVRTLDQV